MILQLEYLNCSDRKAIISRGRVKCAGSSFFLKTHFGIGYQLSYVGLFVAVVGFFVSDLFWSIRTVSAECPSHP